MVTIIISGNRPHTLIEKETVRYAAIDGRLPDLGLKYSSVLMPLVSDNWTKYFKWQGAGTFPKEEKEKLRQFVEQAHSQQKIIRFWATSDNPQVWEELARAGVDLINVDNLEAFAAWYKLRAP